ncbi:MAG: YceI family protein [Thermodesulfobacteriota bacterium]
MNRKGLIGLLLLLALALTPALAKAEVEHFVIDTKKAHAFIEFKVSHLGFSWVLGRFNDFQGDFTVDVDNPENSTVSVSINTASVDTNYAERDKHLRGDDFLDVKKYPKASFVSTGIKRTGEETALITGDFTLHGVTKSIAIKAHHIGSGKDPWGGYRRGFEGSIKFALKDYNIKKDLGPFSKEVEIFLSIEGIRK